MKERGVIFSAPMIRAILDGKKSQTRRIVKPQPIEPAPRPLRHTAKHPGHYLDSYCSERKTQANPRGMSDRWCWWSADDRPDPLSEIRCPYGAPGDWLWVREAWCQASWDAVCDEDPQASDGRPRGPAVRADHDSDTMLRPFAFYRATDHDVVNVSDEDRSPWRSPVHMPRWASRITLEIVDVRVQRVQDISEEDARAEGIDGPHYGRWTDMAGAVVPPLSEPARPWAHSFAVAWREVHRGDDASWFTNPWVWALTFKRMEQPR